ncbi:MAG: TonB-dependent receptor [Terriglobia bacterium]|jgi:hypothetical protein
MMESFGRRLLILGLLLVGSSLPGFGQSTQSTILGTVTDPNGAVVPGASIEVKNTGTTFSRKVTSDDIGNYRVPNLDPGTYSVVAVVPGFSRWVGEGFSLNANQIQRVDIQLAIGQVATSVTVEARGTTLETETATLSNVHTSTEMTQLPMSIYGRSVFNVLSVTAAVQSTNGIIVNGARDNTNSYTVDGVAADDLVSSRQSPDNYQIDIEGIQEVKAQTTNNSAEYTQAAQFIGVTKSGGNQVHGSVLWENFNSYFSTRDFFDYTSTKPSFTNNNEFAGTFGGPVYIPHLYNGRDKTFFFFSYGGQRYRIGARGYVPVPTAAFRQGDFSAISSAVTIRDPQTGTPSDPTTWQPFPNNIIPTARISSVSKALQDMIYPQPNRPGQGDFGVNNNYTTDPGGQFNADTYSVRVDQKISNRNNLFARVGISKTNQDHYPGYLIGGVDNDYFGNVPGRFMAITDTHNFSPGVVNEARMGFVRIFYQDLYGAPLGPNYVGQLGLEGISNPGNVAALNSLPVFSFSRFQGTSGAWVFNEAQNTYNWTDNLTWIRGKHTFKFGADIRRYQVNSVQFPGDQTGSFGFDDTITGFDYASFLLGIPTSTGISTPTPAAYPRSSRYGFYAQDDVRISRKLTLNYGLRYEYQTPWVDKFNRRFAFDSATGSLVVAGNQMPTDLVPEVAATLPIVTAQQAGFPAGALVQADRNNWSPRVGLAYRPLADNKTVVRLGYGWYTMIWPGLLPRDYGTGGPWQTNKSYDYLGGAPVQTFPDPFTASTGFSGVTSISVVNPKIVNERAEQWNLSVGREIWGTAVDVAYAGTKSTRVPIVENLNLLHPSTEPFDAANRPYHLFSSINQIDTAGSAIYHGLTIQAQHKFSNGLYFNANYAYAKALTDSALNGYAPSIRQNQYDRKLEWGPDPSVLRQQLRFGYVYELPFGRGKRFVPNMNRVTDVALGGWQVNGITTMYSGAYMNPSFSGRDPANTNQFSGRPDCVGDPSIGNMRSNIKQGLPMWNVNAFAEPQAGRGSYGNCGRGMLTGPGLDKWNAGLSKNFMLREGMRLQIRWELFNAWNRANFSSGGTDITSGGFGYSGYGGGGRQMLFGGRIDF